MIAVSLNAGGRRVPGLRERGSGGRDRSDGDQRGERDELLHMRVSPPRSNDGATSGDASTASTRLPGTTCPLRDGFSNGGYPHSGRLQGFDPVRASAALIRRHFVTASATGVIPVRADC